MPGLGGKQAQRRHYERWPGDRVVDDGVRENQHSVEDRDQVIGELGLKSGMKSTIDAGKMVMSTGCDISLALSKRLGPACPTRASRAGS